MASILIVDDDETIRDVFYDLFEEEHLCHVAETADKAIKWLETERYDVVLTDISMPGLSGVELLAFIRQKQVNTRVIIITGLSDPEHKRGLIEMGAFDYLSKTAGVKVVEECVKRALEHH